jgi:hypothetical protein
MAELIETFKEKARKGRRRRKQADQEGEEEAVPEI